MKIIGLCGQSGAGKTTALETFTALGFAVIDCDLIARQVTEKGSECLSELVEFFGDSILDTDGTLKRRTLADLAFSDEKRLEALNSITHAHILKAVFSQIEKYREDGYSAVVVDAPTLFESGLDRDCDTTLAICAPRDIRLERIMKRDGISLERAEARISRQISEEELRRICDRVIYNGGSETEFKEKIENYVKEQSLE